MIRVLRLEQYNLLAEPFDLESLDLAQGLLAGSVTDSVVLRLAACIIDRHAASVLGLRHSRVLGLISGNLLLLSQRVTIVLNADEALLLSLILGVWILFGLFTLRRRLWLDKLDVILELGEEFIGLFDFLVLLSQTLLLLVSDLLAILGNGDWLLCLVVADLAECVENVAYDLFVQTSLAVIRIEQELQAKLGQVLAAGKTISRLRRLRLFVFFEAFTLGEHVVGDADVAHLRVETVEKKILEELEDLLASDFERGQLHLRDHRLVEGTD